MFARDSGEILVKGYKFKLNDELILGTSCTVWRLWLTAMLTTYNDKYNNICI